MDKESVGFRRSFIIGETSRERGQVGFPLSKCGSQGRITKGPTLGVSKTLLS